jgi:glucans biosynthesis protein C
MNLLARKKAVAEMPARDAVWLPERYYSLDALRAFALLLGIFYHSLLADVMSPGAWAVGTRAPRLLAGWFVFYAHSFRMQIFFLLAGFFARLVVEKKGTTAYLRDRARRILLVFIVALYPMKWVLRMIWIRGGLETGWLHLPPELEKLPLWMLGLGSLGRESWPKINLTHLWFLYYLSCIIFLFFGARFLVQMITLHSAGLVTRIDNGFRWLAAGWAAPIFLALVFSPILIMMPEISLATPDGSFAWNLPVLLLYGSYFVGGWWLHRQSDALKILSRRWLVYLPLSLVIGSGTALAIARLIATGALAHGLPFYWHWPLAFGMGLTTNLAVFGWVGLFVRKFDQPSLRIRYLADSSYFLYIAHLSLVTALQVWFSSWSLAWWIKVLVINAITFPVLLSIYHLCVRFTWIGAWLNGRRSASSAAAISPANEVVGESHE